MSYLQLNDNKNIYYRFIEGNSNNPCLIFLHEGLGCTTMWKDFPDRLCHKTQCPGLVYDRLGYGKSSPLSRTRTIHYMHDYALNELPKVIENIIPNNPFILIGHSDGGSISLIFGSEKPALLKGIITEAAHVFVEPETLKGIEAADEAYEKGYFSNLSKYHGEKTHSIFKAWAGTWRSKWFKYWNIEYLLPSIECPLLVIQGCQDQYGSSRQVESIVSKSAGNATAVLVEDCGHSPHQEQTEKVLQIMSDFITTCQDLMHH
jgi:pimeloyl-ACP methyl ester carboxylesterase